MNTAPTERTVCQLTGRRAPSIVTTLADLDADAAELSRLRDENAELRCRVDELTTELATERAFHYAAQDQLESYRLAAAAPRPAGVAVVPTIPPAGRSHTP